MAASLLVIPTTAAYSAYPIYSHGRVGQTVGKHAMGIRGVRTNGERIGWREAWLRSSVDMAFAIGNTVSRLVALATIPDSEYYGVDLVQRTTNLDAHAPSRLAWTFVGV
jgi:uncharacterized RDD family membrane protein YckC